MGFPIEAITPPDAHRDSWRRLERKRNSWRGNGFHAPSIMLFIWIVSQAFVAKATKATCHDIRLGIAYAGQEQMLRDTVAGTFWQPGYCIPGLLAPSDFVQDIRRQMEGISWLLMIWIQIPQRFEDVDLRILQLYWMDTVIRSRNQL